MAKKQFAIFYLESNKAYLYGSNLPALLSIDLPTDTISYFDLINRDKFYQLIQTIVTTNKIEQVPLLILFSPYATFEKDITKTLPDEINNDIQQFLDSVPFEHVLSRIYKLQEKINVIAVNKDLYEVIKHAFEKCHFPTVAVDSVTLLQKVIPDLGERINFEVLANKIDTIKQYSLISLEEINNHGHAKKEETGKTDPRRLYTLVGVFSVLVIALGIVLFTSSQQPPPKPLVVKYKTSPTVVTATPTPTVAPVVESTHTATQSSGKVIIVSPTPSGKPLITLPPKTIQ